MNLGKLNIGIVGCGFVGKAVEYAFTNPHTDFYRADPIFGTDVDSLITHFRGLKQSQVTFVCLPSPSHPSGRVDDATIIDTVVKLLIHTAGGVILKSTVPPSTIKAILEAIPKQDGAYQQMVARFVYNPEFLQEADPYRGMVEPEFVLIGGTPDGIQAVREIYADYSSVRCDNWFMSNPFEAALIKYAINAYLATQVTFFNELYNIVDGVGLNFNRITGIMCADSRVNSSHSRVPGPDNKKGFGGACLPKDLSALIHEFPESTKLLQTVQKINNETRSQYDLSEREQDNGINYGQVEEVVDSKGYSEAT